MWNQAELRDYALYMAVRSLPVDWCSALGAKLAQGSAGRLSRPEADARGRAAMALLRPDLATPDRIDATMRRWWGNVGRTFAESSVVPRMLAQGRTVYSDPDRLDAALADDRSVIGAFVHLGNWELTGAQLTMHPSVRDDRVVSGVIMPPTNRAHAAIAERQRAGLAVDLVPQDARLWRRMTEILSRPRGIAWLAVDELVDGVVMAPHFGRQLKPNGNMGKVVRLAAATGARIVPLYSERLYDADGRPGAHFISHILPPLDVPRGRLGPEGVLEQVARLDAVFAPIVRKHLDQWLWTVDLVSLADDPIIPPLITSSSPPPFGR